MGTEMRLPTIIFGSGSTGRRHNDTFENNLSGVSGRRFDIANFSNNYSFVRGVERRNENQHVVGSEYYDVMENKKPGLQMFFGSENSMERDRYDGRRDESVDCVERIYNRSSQIANDESRRMASELYQRHSIQYGRYLTDVVVPPRHVDLDQVVEEIASLARLKSINDYYGFRVIARHDDHVHIAHACSYSNRSCRCSWLCNSPAWRRWRRPRLRRGTILASLTAGDWQRIDRYYSTDGRVAVYSIGGEEDGRIRVHNLNRTRQMR